MTIIQPYKPTDPRWVGWAIHEATDGIAEEPNHDNRGPVIDRLIKLAKCGTPGDPYCAIGVNAALETFGIRGTRSPAARSFEHSDYFVKLPGPAYGAIQTFWRIAPSSGKGHVNFYTGETEHHAYGVGWNQHDDCNVSPFPKHGQSFGLVGYWWPKGEPMPAIRKIMLAGNGKPLDLKVV